jgi:hypothetical protein
MRGYISVELDLRDQGRQQHQRERCPIFRTVAYRMIALEVDDMQKTADYLRTKGVDIVWGPRVRETYSRAEICDPNGYHIELRQWFR